MMQFQWCLIVLQFLGVSSLPIPSDSEPGCLTGRVVAAGFSRAWCCPNIGTCYVGPLDGSKVYEIPSPSGLVEGRRFGVALSTCGFTDQYNYAAVETLIIADSGGTVYIYTSRAAKFDFTSSKPFSGPLIFSPTFSPTLVSTTIDVAVSAGCAPIGSDPRSVLLAREAFFAVSYPSIRASDITSTGAGVLTKPGTTDASPDSFGVLFAVYLTTSLEPVEADYNQLLVVGPMCPPAPPSAPLGAFGHSVAAIVYADDDRNCQEEEYFNSPIPVQYFIPLGLVIASDPPTGIVWSVSVRAASKSHCYRPSEEGQPMLPAPVFPPTPADCFLQQVAGYECRTLSDQINGHMAYDAFDKGPPFGAFGWFVKAASAINVGPTAVLVGHPSLLPGRVSVSASGPMGAPKGTSFSGRVRVKRLDLGLRFGFTLEPPTCTTYALGGYSATTNNGTVSAGVGAADTYPNALFGWSGDGVVETNFDQQYMATTPFANASLFAGAPGYLDGRGVVTRLGSSVIPVDMEPANAAGLAIPPNPVAGRLLSGRAWLGAAVAVAHWNPYAGRSRRRLGAAQSAGHGVDAHHDAAAQVQDDHAHAPLRVHHAVVHLVDTERHTHVGHKAPHASNAPHAPHAPHATNASKASNATNASNASNASGASHASHTTNASHASNASSRVRLIGGLLGRLPDSDDVAEESDLDLKLRRADTLQTTGTTITKLPGPPSQPPVPVIPHTIIFAGAPGLPSRALGVYPRPNTSASSDSVPFYNALYEGAGFVTPTTSAGGIFYAAQSGDFPFTTITGASYPSGLIKAFDPPCSVGVAPPPGPCVRAKAALLGGAVADPSEYVGGVRQCAGVGVAESFLPSACSVKCAVGTAALLPVTLLLPNAISPTALAAAAAAAGVTLPQQRVDPATLLGASASLRGPVVLSRYTYGFCSPPSAVSCVDTGNQVLVGTDTVSPAFECVGPGGLHYWRMPDFDATTGGAFPAAPDASVFYLPTLGGALSSLTQTLGSRVNLTTTVDQGEDDAFIPTADGGAGVTYGTLSDAASLGSFGSLSAAAASCWRCIFRAELVPIPRPPDANASDAAASSVASDEASGAGASDALSLPLGTRFRVVLHGLACPDSSFATVEICYYTSTSDADGVVFVNRTRSADTFCTTSTRRVTVAVTDATARVAHVAQDPTPVPPPPVAPPPVASPDDPPAIIAPSGSVDFGEFDVPPNASGTYVIVAGEITSLAEVPLGSFDYPGPPVGLPCRPLHGPLSCEPPVVDAFCKGAATCSVSTEGVVSLVCRCIKGGFAYLMDNKTGCGHYYVLARPIMCGSEATVEPAVVEDDGAAATSITGAMVAVAAPLGLFLPIRHLQLLGMFTQWCIPDGSKVKEVGDGVDYLIGQWGIVNQCPEGLVDNCNFLTMWAVTGIVGAVLLMIVLATQLLSRICRALFQKEIPLARLSWRMNFIFAFLYLFELAGLPLVHFASGVVFVNTSEYSGGAWAVFIIGILTMVLVFVIWAVLTFITAIQCRSLYFKTGDHIGVRHSQVAVVSDEAGGHGTNHSTLGPSAGDAAAKDPCGSHLHFAMTELHPLGAVVADGAKHPLINRGATAWWPGLVWWGSHEGNYSGTPYGTPVVRMFGLFFGHANPANLWWPPVEYAFWMVACVILGMECESQRCCTIRFAVVVGISAAVVILFALRRPLLGDNSVFLVAYVLELSILIICLAATATDTLAFNQVQTALEVLLYITFIILLILVFALVGFGLVRSYMRKKRCGPFALLSACGKEAETLKTVPIFPSSMFTDTVQGDVAFVARMGPPLPPTGHSGFFPTGYTQPMFSSQLVPSVADGRTSMTFFS